MQLEELSIYVSLSKPLHFTQVPEALGKLISSLMYAAEYTATLHEEKTYKGYVFDSLVPFEKSKTYEPGKTYRFRLRSFNGKLIDVLEKSAQGYENALFNIQRVKRTMLSPTAIQELITLNPVIITKKEGGFWMQEDDIQLFFDRLYENLLKNYAAMTGDRLEESFTFIEALKFLNRRPFTLKYKGIQFAGNKVRLRVYDDPVSQKLAHLALGVGLGEKSSSVGAGFCDWR